MFELGKTLKKYVVSTGYSIRTAAKTLNYDRGTLNSILNGKRKISGELFVQLIDLLDITEQERQDLIELYHKEIYGDDYEVFNEIKHSLNGYNDTFFYDELISFENIPVNEEKLNDKCIIDGEMMVKEAVQGVIALEMQKKHPCIWFNVDLLQYNLLSMMHLPYRNLREKIDLKNIVCFSTGENNKYTNFKLLSSLFPIMFDGYCPYYCFAEANIQSDLSLIFPYYIITSERVILISNKINKAMLFTNENREIIDIYKNQFLSNIEKCKKFSSKFYDLPELPSVFSGCLSKMTVFSGVSSGLCILPLLSKEHWMHIFSEAEIDNYEHLIDESIKIYKQLTNTSKDTEINTKNFAPVEGIRRFIKTGKDELFISNDYTEPLTVKQRIEILERILNYIKAGGEYKFYEAEFLDIKFDINLIASEILLYNVNSVTNKKNFCCTIDVPRKLLSIFESFLDMLSKNYFVLSKDRSIKALEDGIEEAKLMLNGIDSN